MFDSNDTLRGVYCQISPNTQESTFYVTVYRLLVFCQNWTTSSKVVLRNTWFRRLRVTEELPNLQSAIHSLDAEVLSEYMQRFSQNTEVLSRFSQTTLCDIK